MAGKEKSAIDICQVRAIEQKGNNSRGTSLWLCLCECGKESIVPSQRLRHGRSKSCGCARKDKPGPAPKHGKINTSEYESWHHMKSRCLNPKNKDYKHYAGRGITVCDRWKSFENF